MSIEDLAGSLRKVTGGVPPAGSGSGASGGGGMPPWLVKLILFAVGIFILSAFFPIELIVLIAIGYAALSSVPRSEDWDDGGCRESEQAGDNSYCE